ncbi:MAG: hypothetical protein ACYC3X_16705 [Pirellulaceae bacterium]
MFGIGPIELLIVLVMGALLLTVPVAIIVLLVVLVRKPNSSQESPSYAQLLEENQRLRAELAAKKDHHA